MDDTAIKWWVRCLRSSGAYADYVRAVDTGDADTQKRLSNEYPKIKDIYADFGDVGQITGPKSFKFWLSTRLHLFRALNVVRAINDLASYVPDGGKLLLEIELTDDMDKVCDEINAVIQGNYYARFHAHLHGVKTLSVHPTPKYMLHTGGEKINANILGAIRKAFYVAGLKQSLEAVSGRKITQTELVFASKLDIKKPFKWTLDPAEEAAINKDGTSQLYVNTDELTLIKRHLKAHKRYTHNVLHGRFPDHS